MTADEKVEVISAATQASAIEVLVGWAAYSAGEGDEDAMRAIERLANGLRTQLQRLAGDTP